MIRLEMKNCNLILTEKQQKYQHYHLEKLISMNILQVKKYYLLMEDFAYSLLEKALEKQTEKQVGALKSLKPSNKKNELKESEGIFLQNLINNLIRAKLKEIVSLQYNIKTNELYYN